VVVVDDDIDPANMNDVIWAMCTRVDAREDVEVLRGCWSTPLDPTSYPVDERIFNSRMVIDACRPGCGARISRKWRAPPRSSTRASRPNGRTCCRARSAFSSTLHRFVRARECAILSERKPIG
jgi:3-polyprenyl-4-hydroxybenzoate decarboxylase